MLRQNQMNVGANVKSVSNEKGANIKSVSNESGRKCFKLVSNESWRKY